MNDVIDRVPGLAARAAYAKQAIHNKLIEHKEFIARYGDDMPEITDWSDGGRPRHLAGSAPRGRQRLSRREAGVNVFAIGHGETAWSLSG